MMRFAPGDRVHLAGLGTGVVRELRGGRYAIEIKGRVVIAADADLEPADGTHKRPRTPPAVVPQEEDAVRDDPGVSSLDLHGKTVDEALAAVEIFISDALLAGRPAVQIIHGRSGGRIKSAVHQYLRRVSAVRSFRLDPRNPGVTIVSL